MVLTEIEKEVLVYLRNPSYRLKEAIQEQTSPINKLSNDEIVSLYKKMDAIIEAEGETRRAMGIYDEMYVLELLNVKENLLIECVNKHLNI